VTAPALSPAAALAWLRSLSADLRGAVVGDDTGAVLAGDPALAARALADLGAARDPAATQGESAPVAVVEDGDLMVARSARHTVAAALGPHALRRLTAADLRSALEALEAR
jgi:hypothetical protein